MDNWALFLDFDGTLVDIAETPDAVAVPSRLPYLLAELRQHLGGALALVSGRSIKALDAMLQPMEFDIAGLHGLEHRSKGQLKCCHPDNHSEFRCAVTDLEERFRPSRGIVIEDKGCAVAVHWRIAPEKQDAVIAAVNQKVEALGGNYRLQLGKAVAEILPVRYNKGEAIKTFMEEPPFLGRRPIFIGDDITDEFGFTVVNAADGISVRVGRGVTGARHFVASPALMRAQLAQWASAGQIIPEFEFAA